MEKLGSLDVGHVLEWSVVVGGHSVRRCVVSLQSAYLSCMQCKAAPHRQNKMHHQQQPSAKREFVPQTARAENGKRIPNKVINAFVFVGEVSNFIVGNDCKRLRRLRVCRIGDIAIEVDRGVLDLVDSIDCFHQLVNCVFLREQVAVFEPADGVRGIVSTETVFWHEEVRERALRKPVKVGHLRREHYDLR